AVPAEAFVAGRAGASFFEATQTDRVAGLPGDAVGVGQAGVLADAARDVAREGRADESERAARLILGTHVASAVGDRAVGCRAVDGWFAVAGDVRRRVRFRRVAGRDVGGCVRVRDVGERVDL